MSNVHMCDCHTLPCMHVPQSYRCPNCRPGYLKEPYHLPGYGGHVASMRDRIGGTFGRLSHDCVEDPCVAQAPIPILQDPCKRCAPDTPCRCDDSHYVPRGSYCTGCATDVYRRCEPMCSSYAGHVPGMTFHSLGRSIGKATFGTGSYIDKCFYYNTFSKI
ncbi:unnamed protein product [Allacma fusca]|uniref:Ciliary microtubule inner protein 2A-C-like domain-containing protein n=1 Tax=Allacma fusca TaxID=39272 RepID=A0A8J2IXA2_9HEXA|nr:unnamed protein product [Allacma fusca]